MGSLEGHMDATDLRTNLQPLQDAMGVSMSPAIQAEALAGMAIIASKDARTVFTVLVGSQALLASLITSPLPVIAYSATYLAQQLVRLDDSQTKLLLGTALQQSSVRHLIH